MLVGKKCLNELFFCYSASLSIVVFCGFSFSGQSEDAADSVCSDLTSTELGSRNNFSDVGGWVESIKTTGK